MRTGVMTEVGARTGQEDLGGGEDGEVQEGGVWEVLVEADLAVGLEEDLDLQVAIEKYIL